MINDLSLHSMRCRAYKTVGCPSVRPSVRPSVCLFRQFYSSIDVRLVCWWAPARAAVIDRQLQAAGSVMLRAIIRGSTRTCLILLSFTNMFHIYASSSRTGVVGVSSSDTFCVREYCKRFLGSDCIIGNESVPIQLAQCRFPGWPFPMLKY